MGRIRNRLYLVDPVNPVYFFLRALRALRG